MSASERKIAALEEELGRLRNLFFATVKTQGRVVLATSVLEGLSEVDGVNVECDDTHVVVTYAKHETH